MKIKRDFVTNGSSTSFIISTKEPWSEDSLPSAPKQYTSCNRDATKTPSVSSTGQRHCVLKLQARPLSTFVMLDGYM